MATRHPLDPLDADEIRAAAAIYRASVGDGGLFSSISLEEPTRDELDAHREGASVERRARVMAIAGPCAVRHAGSPW